MAVLCSKTDNIRLFTQTVTQNLEFTDATSNMPAALLFTYKHTTVLWPL